MAGLKRAGWVVLLVSAACAPRASVVPSAPLAEVAPAPSASVAPAASTPAPAPEPVPAAVQVPDLGPLTLAAVGDVMLGTTFPEETPLPPEDGKLLLAEVAPILRRADLTLGNLEGPMLEGGESRKCKTASKNCYAFRVPTRYGAYLKDAGFDVMALANNHANDFGPEGVDSSMRVLDALGIAHTGRVGDVARVTVRGRKVAFVAFAPSEGMHDINDLEGAARIVAGLKREADLVVVTFHGGAEGSKAQHVPVGHEFFLGEDRGDLRTLARTVIDAGAAVVIGHGPHVVRGMELYKGRLIAYSLGNFATWERFNLSGPLGLTVILEVTLNPDGSFAGGRVHAGRQDVPGGPKLDPTGEVIPLLAALSKEDFGETAVVVRADGTLVAPEALEQAQR